MSHASYASSELMIDNAKMTEMTPVLFPYEDKKVCPSISRFLCKIFLSSLFPSLFFLGLTIGVWRARQKANMPLPLLDLLSPLFPSSGFEFVLYVICGSSIITFFQALSLGNGVVSLGHRWGDQDSEYFCVFC